MEEQIFQNAVRVIKTGECITSIHRHDFVSVDLGDGKMIAVDGGVDYLRKVGALKDRGVLWEDISLSDNSSLKDFKNKLLWGTRGKDGKSPLRYVLLKDCELSHLKSILATQVIDGIYFTVIQHWIKEKS